VPIGGFGHPKIAELLKTEFDRALTTPAFLNRSL